MDRAQGRLRRPGPGYRPPCPTVCSARFWSGIIAGVGGVIGFVPLIIISMFFQLSFLEDLGYMARMAYNRS